MYFADISVVFLRGDYLPKDRRIFIQCPKNYPWFARKFSMDPFPRGARTDVFRMKKAGFGLAESLRFWLKRFKRGAGSIGGREMKLCPGFFSFSGGFHIGGYFGGACGGCAPHCCPGVPGNDPGQVGLFVQFH